LFVRSLINFFDSLGLSFRFKIVGAWTLNIYPGVRMMSFAAFATISTFYIFAWTLYFWSLLLSRFLAFGLISVDLFLQTRYQFLWNLQRIRIILLNIHQNIIQIFKLLFLQFLCQIIIKLFLLFFIFSLLFLLNFSFSFLCWKLWRWMDFWSLVSI